MRRDVLKLPILGLCFLPLVSYADAEMFRPFEPYIEAKFACCSPKIDTGCRGLRCERYEVQRECPSEFWRRRKYFIRHGGTAYMNCCYPECDYPRYNGRPLDIRWHQRQPYYPPPR